MTSISLGMEAEVARDENKTLVAVTADTWELFYWARPDSNGVNTMIGRGEFVRLMFEVAGVPYIDHGMVSGANVVFQFCRGGGNSGFPIFAPPAIKKGEFILYQTPSIMRYLGKEFGFYPTNDEDEAHADALMALVTDFIAEGRLVFHAKCFTASYYDQIEETKGHIAWFETQRLPQFLSFFNKTLQYNNRSGSNNSSHFIGNSLTYVDIAFFHALEAAKSQFELKYEDCVTTNTELEVFRNKIREIPRIAAYLSSERRGRFEGNSMM